MPSTPIDLPTLTRNASICVRCSKRSNPCVGGRCVCTLDGITLTDHARANHCPHPDGSRYLLASPDVDPKLLAAIPRERWPLVVRAIAKLASPGDAGIGDTIHRHLDRFGADAMARLYTRIIGQDCGCDSRRARLNGMYQYERS